KRLACGAISSQQLSKPRNIIVKKGIVKNITRCGDACISIPKEKKKMGGEAVCCSSTCQVKV
ncbi:hypothetical protein HID58_052560, partial [Brassica napus]